MERPSPVILSITTVLLDQVSNCYDKYGKYAKWAAFGILTMFGLNYIIDLYNADKQLTPPPRLPPSPEEAPPSTSTRLATPNPPTPNPPTPEPVRLPPRRPKIYHGIDGPVEFPIIGDRESTTNYVIKHSELSQMYFKEKNYNLASYHSSLLLFIHPDPMTYFETNSGYMSKDTFDTAKRSLTTLLELIEDQMKRDERAQLS